VNFLVREYLVMARKKDGNSSKTFNAEVFTQKLVLEIKKTAKVDLRDALSCLEKGMQSVVEELLKEKNSVFIVNAGRMNHGKSSLLNSILGRNEFKVNDIRETITNKVVEFKPDIFLIDTPGLSANANDDAEAFQIYSKANCILFVHSPRIGELHSEEIVYLKKMRELFPKEFLASHMVLVLTFKEEFDQGQLTIIRNKILEAVRENLGIDSLRVFEVSNSRYLRYCSEKDPAKKNVFLGASGINELNEFISENIPLWKKNNLSLKQNILNKCRKQCTDAFNEVRLEAEQRIQGLSLSLSDVNENKHKLLGVFDRLKEKKRELKNLKNKLESKRSDWRYEKENY